ncbi:MAG: flagellar protein FlaG [Lachnospiraceae bacterium]|nr:flagellar protein FlaG [Lachnospiraceae bacterium]
MDVKPIGSSGYECSRIEVSKVEPSGTEALPEGNLEIGKEVNTNVRGAGNSPDKETNEQPMSQKEQQQRLARLQETLKNHNVEISYNDDVNRYAIRILDEKSKEVVREIPSEKSLEMFAKMLEIEGLLVDEKR